MTDIATRELRQPIDIAEYLFRRLHEVGIRSVHGVPGKSPKPGTLAAMSSNVLFSFRRL